MGNGQYLHGLNGERISGLFMFQDNPLAWSAHGCMVMVLVRRSTVSMLEALGHSCRSLGTGLAD